jgi:hypothetical protein
MMLLMVELAAGSTRVVVKARKMTHRKGQENEPAYMKLTRIGQSSVTDKRVDRNTIPSVTVERLPTARFILFFFQN